VVPNSCRFTLSPCSSARHALLRDGRFALHSFPCADNVLGLELPRGRQIQVRHRRLGDQLNAEWIGRYRARQ
jgi:hypothetical protein